MLLPDTLTLFAFKMLPPSMLSRPSSTACGPRWRSTAFPSAPSVTPTSMPLRKRPHPPPPPPHPPPLLARFSIPCWPVSNIPPPQSPPGALSAGQIISAKLLFMQPISERSPSPCTVVLKTIPALAQIACKTPGMV